MNFATKSPVNTRRPNWAWIWLAYTGFLFIQPIFEPTRGLWLKTIAIFVAYLIIFALYVRSSDRGTTLRFWLIGATFVLGLVTFPWNSGGTTFFIYTAAFLPFSVASVRRLIPMLLCESGLVLAEGYFTHMHGAWPNAIIAVFLLLIIGGGNIFFAEQKRAECKLRAAQEENLALAAVAERERIARDLHDVLGHTLSLVVLKAELAGRLLENEASRDIARAAAEIADVERTARTALAEVREAIGGYRARGLAAEIEAARRTLDAAGVELIAESCADGAVALTPQEETALALALREAVTNIVRHAHARRCVLRLVSVEGQRRLVVEDDGMNLATGEGNGLRGMRERIESLGGRFALERGVQNARGTRISIDLPQRQGATA
jgi:two-component system sensor histidine kinase DesK